MRRRTALKLPLYLAAAAALTKIPLASAASRWSADRANAWYAKQGWLLGANYVTSTAVNQLEMFQAGTYDPHRIAGELSVARRIGMNTMRVFLHDQLWATDRAGFSSRLSEFVAIAASHNIKPLFVLFDSCWDPLPKAGRQRAPIKGVHNSGWVQSPGAHRLQDPAYTRVLQSYVTGVVGMFANDPRVLGWDVWNEPDNPSKDYRKVEHEGKEELVAAFLPHVFQWVRAVNPVQPLTSGVWQGHWKDPGGRSTIANLQLEHSDVISFHSYGDPAEFDARIDELTPLGRPISAPSTWPETWAAPWKEFFRSPRDAMSALTTGGSSPGGRRHIYRGIPGSSPTPRSRRHGSAISSTPTGGHMTTTRFGSSRSSLG